MKQPWDNRLAWTLSILVGLAMTIAGSGKLFDADQFVGMFRQFGYPMPRLMVYVTGALETAGGLMLFVPSLAAYGAVTVGVVMMAATATHFVAQVGTPVVSVTLLLLAAATGWLRWSRRWLPEARIS